MKSNDLSNRFSPIIAFRIEGFLLKPSESKMDKFMSRFKANPFATDKVIMDNVKLMTRIWRTTDYSINLYAIGHPSIVPHLEGKLNVVPHSNIFAVDDYVELRDHLDSQYTTYYFDSDKQALSVVGSMGRDTSEIAKIVR